jgi:hypothetical protein
MSASFKAGSALGQMTAPAAAGALLSMTFLRGKKLFPRNPPGNIPRTSLAREEEYPNGS